MAGKISTRMPLGTWKRSDMHPTIDGRIFDRYSGSTEVWATQEKLDAKRAYEKQWRRKDRKSPLKPNYNTDSKRGTFKLWDEHPIHKGMFFKRYETRKGILRENWCSKDKMENAKQYEMIARLDRRVAIEASDLSERDKAMILDIYAVRDIMNAAHGRIMYHVDHIIPLAKNGSHHPSNLQIATAIWNLRKGKKLK